MEVMQQGDGRDVATAVPGMFRHVGLLYQDPEEYGAACAGFARRGLDAGDPVLVAVPGARDAVIRAALGARAADVSYADMSVDGRNPGRIIPAVLLRFAEEHAGRRVWIVGEPIWAGRSAVEYPACAAHEALINVAFAGRDAAILCPYDTTGLAPGVVRDAYRTHPVMADAVGERPSAEYAAPESVAAAFDRPLPAPPASAHRLRYDRPAELSAVRAFVARRATAAGMPAERVSRLQVAVNELATNTLRHTDAGGTVTVWPEGGVFVCQVDDTGRLTDPLAGRIPPSPYAMGGRGLVLVNEVVDLVRMHRHPAGLTVRLHLGARG